MPLGHVWQTVSRLEGELLEDLRRCPRSRLCGCDFDVVETQPTHTPVRASHAITCSCGKTRADANSARCATCSHNHRYRSPTASRIDPGAGTGVPADRYKGNLSNSAPMSWAHRRSCSSKQTILRIVRSATRSVTCDKKLRNFVALRGVPIPELGAFGDTVRRSNPASQSRQTDPWVSAATRYPAD